MIRKVFLDRLGLFFYWAGFFFAFIFLVMSLDNLLEGKFSIAGLLFFILFYFFGFGIRFLLTGKTDHFIVHYFHRLITRK